MTENLRQQLNQIQKQYKDQRRKKGMRSLLGFVCLFIVLFGLLLPAFTLEKQTYCGFEEHTHKDECYEYILDCPVTGESGTVISAAEFRLLPGAAEAEAALEKEEKAGNEDPEDVVSISEPKTEVIDYDNEVVSPADPLIPGDEIPATSSDYPREAEEDYYLVHDRAGDGEGAETDDPGEAVSSGYAVANSFGAAQEVPEGTGVIIAASNEEPERVVLSAEAEDGPKGPGAAEDEEGEAFAVEMMEDADPAADQTGNEDLFEDDQDRESAESAEVGTSENVPDFSEDSGLTLEYIGTGDTETEVSGVEYIDGEGSAADTAGSDTKAEIAAEAAGTHVHTAACYRRVLICGLEEHTHGLSCFIDKEADVEDLQKIEDLFPTFEDEKVKDSYEYAGKLAEFQQGYRESVKNYMVLIDEEDNETPQGYTRYGDWAGDEYAVDWSPLFAAFTAEYAGLDIESFNALAGNPAGHEDESRDYLVTAYDWMQALRDVDPALYEESSLGSFARGTFMPIGWVDDIADNMDDPESGDVAEDPGTGLGEHISLVRDVENYIGLNYADYLEEDEEGNEILSASYYEEGHPAAPAVGELVFLDLDEDTYADHVGIITAVNLRKDRMSVMVGDIDDRVKEEKYSFDDMAVLGFVRLPETAEAIQRNIEVNGEHDVELESFGEIELESEADEEETAESEVELELSYLHDIVTVEREYYAVTLEIGEDAKIPDWAEISVEEITEGSPEYSYYESQALDAIGNVTDAFAFARFFDISFSIDGEEIEPKAPISVTISYDDSVDVPEGGIRKAIHFADEDRIEVIGIDSVVEDSDEEIHAAVEDGIVSADAFDETAADDEATIDEAGAEEIPADNAPIPEAKTADFSQDEAFATAMSSTEDPGLLGGIKKLGKGLRSLLIKDTTDLESEMGIADAAAAENEAAGKEADAVTADKAEADDTLADSSDDIITAVTSDTEETKDVAVEAAASDQAAQNGRKEAVKAGDKPAGAPKRRSFDSHTFSFVQESFSVTGTVVYYTVDFHWEVNGKTYEFGIPGGGFVSFTKLVEVLGIGADDKDTEAKTEITETLDGEAEQNAEEEQEVFDLYDEVIRLNELEVSDATRKFVEGIEKVEFSSPELVWVGKTDAGTTIGELKEKNGLTVQYSAELTKEQIANINAQSIEAGDWALISLQAFDTEETLTVTMKDGEQFVIRVTDASYSAFKTTNLDGKTAALVNLRNNNALQSTAHNTSGRLNAVSISYNESANRVQTTDPNQTLTKWTFEKVPNTNDQYYIHASNGYLNINGSSLTVTNTRQALQVQQKNNGTIRIRTSANFAVNNAANDTNNGYFGYQNGGDDNRGEWFTVFMLDTIVLSPMNENGVLSGNPDSGNVTSTHYKKMTIDGSTIDDNNHANLARSRIYIPVEYNNDGTATITLPSNDQLGSFHVSSADPLTHSVIQDSGKYQWELHGWVNIATGEYYDVTDGPVTATVSRNNLNVFYADWWAADYSYTIPEGQRADTVDTNSFVSIKMWDYNEMFNLHGSDVWKVDGDTRRYITRDSLESEEWYIKNGPYFQFVDNTDPGNCWQYGTLGNTQDRGRYNQWSNYSYSGTLGILGEQGQVPSTGVLESLFPASVTPGSGVNYLGTGNYLFSYNESTKTYSYDSSLNAAVYNQDEQRFYVSNTDKKYYRGPGYYQSSVGGFFPLNDYEKTLSYNNGTTNNWLGISIDLDFWLPDTPGSSENANTLAGHHMRFDFTGDDDVWVLIDGKLALDIGGIHEAVSGYIDFTTGEIRNAKENTYRLSDMGIGAGAHTLSFYYLEQGGNASNCKISFNIVPRWEEEPVHFGTANVSKTWSPDTPDEAKQAVSFSLQTSDGTPVPGTTVGYSAGTVTEGVWKYTWEGLDPAQVYVVVEQPDPRFNQTQPVAPAITEIKDVWAAASYHKNNAFGSDTILLGNDLPASQGGKLLNSGGGSDNADFVDHVVKAPEQDGNNDKWTVEGYSSTNQHFYLKNSAGQYLSIKNGNIALVNTSSDASWFYMSPSGDLNDANSDYRLMVNGNGSIGVGAIVNSADETDTNSSDRIHIYTFYEGTFAKTTNYQYANAYKTKEISVHKEWSDSPAVDHTSDTITIALYQKAINGEGEIVAETEYPITSPNTDTITGSGTITLSGLPEAGVYEGQFVSYEYRVAEVSGKEGYVSQTHEESADQWTISNIAPDSQDQPTSITVTKSWKHPDGSNAAADHENDVITFKLLQRAVESAYVPVTIRWVDGDNTVSETQQFYIEKGGNLSFRVSREWFSNWGKTVTMTTDRKNADRDSWTTGPLSTYHDYHVNSITNGITISVKLDTRENWSSNQWSHSVTTTNLKSSVNEVAAADVSTDTADSEEQTYTLHKDSISEGPFDESAENWVATIADLPLYKKISDGVYYSYYYTISELSVNGNPVLPSGTTTSGQTDEFTVSIDQGTVTQNPRSATITNTEKEKTAATAAKAWVNADGTATPPAGTSVTFELYADGTETGKTVRLNGKKDVPEEPGASEETIETAGNSAEAFESPAWTATWSNLQKYAYNEDGSKDHEIVYTIRELTDSIPAGYVVDYGTNGDGHAKTEAENGGTITNKQLSTELEILKVDAKDMTTPLEGALFELRKINPESTVSSVEYLDETHYPVYPDTSREDHKTGADGKATFSRLTYGYYEVTEAELPPGYVLTGNGRFYIRVDNGAVTFVEKTPDGQWHPSSGNDKLVFTPASGTSPASAKVGNTAGTSLPSTGGPGTRIFTILGSMLMVFAGAMILIRKRPGGFNL